MKILSCSLGLLTLLILVACSSETSMSVEQKVEATVEAMAAHKSLEATVIAEYYQGLTATVLPTNSADSVKEASPAPVNSSLPTSGPQVIIKIVTPIRTKTSQKPIIVPTVIPVKVNTPTSVPTAAPTPVPTPTVALYTQYTAALSELEPQYYQPLYQSMWDENYRLLLGHWLLSTGDKPIDKQLRFYEWLLIRKPNLYQPVPWAILNENWKTALSISSNPPSTPTKDSPALYWYLSSKNPDLADAVLGLTAARYSEGAIPGSSYSQRMQNDGIENMYVRHVNRVVMEGKGPASFLSYMAELNPDRLGPKD